jgi:hypothetical protein
MPLLQILTDPQNFRFYAGGLGHVSNADTFGQKSIPYGNDRPDRGSSNQPYIQKEIPEGERSSFLSTGGEDFLLRGGIKAPLNAAEDISRLTQMFFDLKSPKGVLFTAKENLLSRTSVKTEASKGAGYGGGGVNQGVYLPTSTILQAGAGFTGTHLNLLGIDPSSPISGVVEGGLLPGLGLNGYSSIMKQKFNESLNNPELLKKNNRLVGLYDAISLGESKERFGGQEGVNLNTNGGTVLLEYGGGPGSILGIGKTRIPFADQRTGTNNPKVEGNNFENEGVYIHGKNKSIIPYPSPFKDKIPKIPLGSSIFSTTNETITLNPKLVNKSIDSVKDYLSGVKNSPTQREYKYPSPSQRKYDFNKILSLNIPLESEANNEYYPDLIKFKITSIDNDNMDFNRSLYFNALIDSFSDNYLSTWNPINYIGRGEPLFNYQGFTRQISLSFKVSISDKQYLTSTYKKLNYLASLMAPDYNSGGFMRGNLIKLTIGGYLYEQPGFITSMTYTIPSEIPWETQDNNNYKQLPHLIEVSSFSFTPIHTFLPQKVKGDPNTGDTKQKYIALTNARNNNYKDPYDPFLEPPSPLTPLVPGEIKYSPPSPPDNLTI